MITFIIEVSVTLFLFSVASSDNSDSKTSKNEEFFDLLSLNTK